MELGVLGIVKNQTVTGTPRGFVQSFYCSCPISNATLIIQNVPFVSKYVGPDVVGTFSMYKIVFFDNELSVSLGRLATNNNTITVHANGAVDGSVIFYSYSLT